MIDLDTRKKETTKNMSSYTKNVIASNKQSMINRIIKIIIIE